MRSTLTFGIAALCSTFALAQATPPEQDHAAHHPAGASAPAPATKGAAKPAQKPAQKPDSKSGAAVNAPSPAQLDSAMQSMRDMHDKVMAAKTPQERQALMADHMKAMKDGMDMMGNLKAGQPQMGMGGMGAKGGMDGMKGMHAHHDMMSKRMDMMEMMMQMMMDREAARAMPAQ